MYTIGDLVDVSPKKQCKKILLDNVFARREMCNK